MPGLISRERALELGLKRYFTGLPCKYGHISERKVCDHGCYECSLLKSKSFKKSYYQKNKEEVKRKVFEYRKSNLLAAKSRDKARYNKKREELIEQQRERYKSNKDLYKTYARNRKEYIKRATPIWIDSEESWLIDQIYSLCVERSLVTGIEHQVDHILPLRGKKVCGLHQANNLRVITRKENITKFNNYEVI